MVIHFNYTRKKLTFETVVTTKCVRDLDQTNQNDYFLVTFDHFWAIRIFVTAEAAAKIVLSLKPNHYNKVKLIQFRDKHCMCFFSLQLDVTMSFKLEIACPCRPVLPKLFQVADHKWRKIFPRTIKLLGGPFLVSFVQ